MANKPFKGIKSSLLPDDYLNDPVSVAGLFDANTEYSKGAYVYHGLKLYCFTADHAAGAWTGSDAVEVTVGEELTSLKQDLTDDLKYIADKTAYKFTSGKAIKTTVGSTVNWQSPVNNSPLSYTVVECSAGDIFTITGVGATNNYTLYCFIDSSGNILERSGASSNYSAVVLTAPQNTARLVVNVFTADPHFLFNGLPIYKEINDITDEVTTINGEIGDTDYRIIINDKRQTGYYWNSENATAVKTSYSSYACYDRIQLENNTKYKAHVYQGSSAKQNPLLLVDSSNTIIQKISGTNSTFNDFEFVSGTNQYLLITTTSGYNADLFKTVASNIPEVTGGLYDWKNKTVAIIGDSISTNGNYSASNLLGNIPEIVISSEDVGVELSAYATYYDIGTEVGGHEIVANDVGTEITFTPVAGDVGKFVGVPDNANNSSIHTWWEICAERLGFNPIPVCWSGASITSHEGDTEEYKTSYAWHPAQIRKCGIRTPGTMMRTAPDVIIIYRGTNDYSHTPYAKLTADYFDTFPWTAPQTDAVTDGYGYKEGLCLTILKLRQAYPSARIVLCTCNFFKRVNYSSFPVNNGVYTENQLNNAIREVANYMGCDVLEFDKDGLTFENASSLYYQDGTAFTHPTTIGHEVIGKRALRDLTKINSMT